MMDTNDTVHDLIKKSDDALALAKDDADKSIHSLMGKLRDWYQAKFGAVHLDLLDWHWQATALKNHVNNGEESDSHHAYVAGTAPDDPANPQSLTSPTAAAAGTRPTGQPVKIPDAPMGQGRSGQISTVAPGTPTSLGTPLGAPAPSIKPAPDPTDPTDSSFIKERPAVTDPVQGGVTETPGSPAAEESPPPTHTPKS